MPQPPSSAAGPLEEALLFGLESSKASKETSGRLLPARLDLRDLLARFCPPSKFKAAFKVACCELIPSFQPECRWLSWPESRSRRAAVLSLEEEESPEKRVGRFGQKSTDEGSCLAEDESEGSFTQWYGALPFGCASLRALDKDIRPSRRERRAKEHLRRILEQCASTKAWSSALLQAQVRASPCRATACRLLPGEFLPALVLPYGSAVTGLGVWDSDADFAILLPLHCEACCLRCASPPRPVWHEGPALLPSPPRVAIRSRPATLCSRRRRRDALLTLRQRRDAAGAERCCACASVCEAWRRGGLSAKSDSAAVLRCLRELLLASTWGWKASFRALEVIEPCAAPPVLRGEFVWREAASDSRLPPAQRGPGARPARASPKGRELKAPGEADWTAAETEEDDSLASAERIVLVFEVTAGNALGVFNSSLLAAYRRLSPVLAPLTRLVRHWAQVRGLPGELRRHSVAVKSALRGFGEERRKCAPRRPADWSL